MIKTYYLLTKPGIVMGNILTAAMGFFLLSQSHNYALFCWMCLGLIAVIASGCIFNNYIDRKSDAEMERTKKRGFAQNIISIPLALFFATFLGVGGALILYSCCPLAALIFALLGFIIYVGLYSFLKYRSVHATLVGSLAGATPPVIGYLTAGGALDGKAFYLFLLMLLWQMPHFFAIAIYRFHDYQKANIPVLPVAVSIAKTKKSILLYIALLTLSLLLLPFLHLTTFFYALMLSGSALLWLLWGIQKRGKEDLWWGRQMFRISLFVITIIAFSLILYIHKQEMLL